MELAETGEAVLVEIEDYNFGGGQFLDNPEASGTTVNGATLPNIESSYYDRLGVPEVDFHDSDTGPISENDYRSDDFTGLTAGLAEIDPGGLQSDQARS